MEAVAHAKFLRGSARKMRIVADLVRGEQAVRAAELLRHVPRRAAVPLRKTIESAVANALSTEGTAKMKAEDLWITAITVDGGPIARRFRAVGMGRSYRIRKRFCHLTVRIADAETFEDEDRKQRRKKKG